MRVTNILHTKAAKELENKLKEELKKEDPEKSKAEKILKENEVEK